jgi:hypothetical protein
MERVARARGWRVRIAAAATVQWKGRRYRATALRGWPIADSRVSL